MAGKPSKTAQAVVGIIAGLIIAFVIVAIYLGYQYITEPSFSIELKDLQKKNGRFVFDGASMYFDPFTDTTFLTQSPWLPWSLKVYPKGDNVVFDLYKSGKFVRNLETTSFKQQ